MRSSVPVPLPLALPLVVFAVACGAATLSPAPAPPRQGLVGEWTLEFRLDSMRTSAAWGAGSQQTAKGTFRVADTGVVVHSTIDVDFTPLLGRQMSCYDPRPTTTAIGQSAEATTLVFTPNAADCGFSASGKFYGDSLIGTWSETSFIGPVAVGRFRMVRAR